MKTDSNTLDMAYTDIQSYRAISKEIRELQKMLDNQAILEEFGRIYQKNIVDIDLSERDIESLIANREHDIDKLKKKLEEL